jgi:hypothetical protein|nr:MAG TPA: thymidylate synthase, flavin-dependent [Caudoviricetes sp.]
MKHQTQARIIADSISASTGQRITTFEVEFPRIVLAQLNTHKMIAKSYASSRAIPIEKNIEMIQTSPFMPAEFGKNKPGMAASQNLEGEDLIKARREWLSARDKAIWQVKELASIGVHKQLANRLLEPFSYIKGIITATEFKNFFFLRIADDAQPEIRELAEKMKEAMNDSMPQPLHNGEWHLPYFVYTGAGTYRAIFNNELELPLEEARMISVSLCAQVSYRNEDASLEKAKKLWKILFEGRAIHGSAAEHQATPVTSETDKGITHFLNDEKKTPCSGNLQNWIQYRQLFNEPDHCGWRKETLKP